MSFVAGQIVRASALNRIQPAPYTASQSGNGGSTQTLTTTSTDCKNCTISFTTLTAAVCIVVAHFDFEVTVVGASTCQGQLVVDGSMQSGEAHKGIQVLDRITPGFDWKFTVSGAGVHTAKLQVAKTAAAGTASVYDVHTTMKLWVNEVV